MTEAQSCPILFTITQWQLSDPQKAIIGPEKAIIGPEKAIIGPEKAN